MCIWVPYCGSMLRRYPYTHYSHPPPPLVALRVTERVSLLTIICEKIWHVRLVAANNMHPLSWMWGGGRIRFVTKASPGQADLGRARTVNRDQA